MAMRFVGILAAALAASAVSACAVVQEKTLGESFDEAAAGSEIKTRMFANGGFSRFGEVDVEVAGRFVLLTGRVPSEADRIEAERIAWTISSVDEVANELVIDRRSVARDVNDRWITEQVRARLIANRDVKGLNYNIQVYDGAVYLLGYAQAENEIRVAAEEASRVRGVQKVISYVKLRDRAAPQPQRALQASGGVEIAPDSDAPAPIIPPDRQPTQRGAYPDPYAPASSTRSGVEGLQSAPLTPIVP